MVRSFKAELAQIITLVLFILLCLMFRKKDDSSSLLYKKIISSKPAQMESLILPNCSCLDKDGNTYNFCYINPNNLTMIGKRFDCKHLEAVKELGLFDMDYIDLSRDEMPDPQFVTAISGNHILEGRRQLKNLHGLWPDKTIVVFDMGLGEYRKEYESDLLVDLRDFPFDKYSTYMQRLLEYRWKPIIIAEMLNEFGAIFYIDSSITFNDPDLSPVYNLMRCKNKNNRLVTFNIAVQLWSFP